MTKNYAELIQGINQGIPDNDQGLVSPADVRQNMIDLADWAIELPNIENPKGAYNASTNTPTLSATPDSTFKDGAYYDNTVSGAIGFAGINFTSGTIVNVGDRLIKKGTQWYLMPLSNYPSILKGILSYNSSVSIDNNIANAIKNIYLELKSSYSGNSISIRILGYVSGTGLIAQIYNVTTSSVIYTIVLDSSVAKPSGLKTYTVHLPNEYFLTLLVDWSSFSGNFLQSSTYSILLTTYNYNTNRLALGNYTNGIRSFTNNGTDERIAYAIKFIRFENSTMFGNTWGVAQMGYDGTSAVFLRLRNVTTNTTYSYKLEDAVDKPSGIKRYFVNTPYDSYIELVVDWNAFVESNIISSAFTTNIIVNNYDKNRASFSQFYTGVNSFSVNGNDERLALAIKDIYFEFIDNSVEFAISYLGFNGTSLVASVRNLSTSTTYTYLLGSDTSKPSGIKSYQIHVSNESYISLSINWDSFISQGVSSSTYTTKIRVNKYNFNRANQLASVDENQEIYRINTSKSFINAQIDWSKYPLEVGSLSSTAQDSVNSNRFRTKYSIPVLGGSVLNYTIATNYTLLVQQVLTTGVKTYTLINDSGYLSGTGSITLNNRTDSIRLIFRKLSGGSETKLYPEEITTSNFSVTANYAVVDSVNNAIKFTDNQLFNRFVREMFVEGLDISIPYTIFFVQRNASGLYKFYIRNKNTNTDVFVYAPSALEAPNENSIFDITIGSVRVRAVLDWTALPNGFNTSSLGINLTDKIFNINYSPRLSAFYADKETRGSRLITTRNASAIDKNHVSNSVIPHKNYLTAWMNSINAEQVKANTQVTYDTISYAKNGSVGLLIGGFVYEFCNEKDSSIYDSDCNVFVRKVNLATKSMVSKVKILGFGDTIGGEAMTKIPYVFSGIQISTTIRIYIRVVLATSGVKMGYIDYNTTNDTFGTFTELTLNSTTFSYTTYFSYLKTTLGSTFVTAQNFTSRDLTIGKHIMSFGGYYYMLIGCSVGVSPYAGANHSLARSTDGISWTIVYTFSDRGGQDDGDMYIKDGILYAQLRQNFGSGFSTIVAYNLSTQKEVTSQNLSAGTSRGEFFEYSGSLYLLLNTTDTRQYASLYKISYANESMDISSILSVENWVSNWSIHYYDSKIYVFFGVQVWEFKIDQYNNSINTALFDLLK